MAYIDELYNHQMSSNTKHTIVMKNICYMVSLIFAINYGNFAFSSSQPCVFSKASKLEQVIDASFLNSEKVCVYKPTSISKLQGFVKMISFHNQKKSTKIPIKISIAGTKHSQGGHIFAENGILVDMSSLKKIDQPFKKDNQWLVKAQAGATWVDLHDVILPMGLVNRVQQSSAPFSIGGSVAVNCHGRSQWDGPIYHTVESLTIIDSEGKLRILSKSQDKKLFDLVIGGYGLFGIIVDVTLDLELNHKLDLKVFHHESLEDYIKMLSKVDRKDKSLAYQFSILDLSLYYAGKWVPEKFLKKNTSYWYYAKKDIEKPGERNFDAKEGVMNDLGVVALKLAKSSRMVRNMLQWGQQEFLKKQLSRSMMLTPPIQTVLNSQNQEKPDILQEYFVPVERFSGFFAEFRKLLIDQLKDDKDLAISNVSLRYIPHSENDSRLRYSRKNQAMVAMVLYTQINRKFLKKEELRTTKLVDLVLKHDGVYYLPYQLWPTKNQLMRAYPNIDQFVMEKKNYDPSFLFSNRFYEHYFPL